MKATLRQIIEGNAGLQLMLGSKLPVKASYAVSKLARACASELDDFNKQREKLFTDAGCTVVGQEYAHSEGKEKIAAIIKEVEQLKDVEVEINALPLDLEQFGSGELPGAAFFGLDWAMKT